MKKLTTLILVIAMLASVCVFASAEAETVYGTATLTYAEFYSGDVSETEYLDAVSSATTGKAKTFANTSTDFVDAETNPDGYHILGIANVNVALNASDVEAYQAINPTFVISEEVPDQYKPVTIEDGKAVYGATVLNIADSVNDATIQVLTDSRWGDYQINIIENSTSYIRNTRSNEGFAINSGVMGVIVETESGLKVGMEHMQSIWIQPYEVSWNVSVDNSHNTELAYDNIAELDKLMGETIVKVTYINQNDAYEYNFDGAYLPIKFESSLSVENAGSASGSTKVTAIGLPEDYSESYSVSGLEIAVEGDELTWNGDAPGSYTLTLSDANGKYAPLSAAFVLSTDILPVAYDADNLELITAEGASDEMKDAFIKNLTSVSVNGKSYSASGRGAVVIINSLGELDTEAAVTSGSEQTLIFGEAGEYSIVATAVGFENALEFTVVIK